MSAPISRSSVALLAVGSVAILLLGAFSRSDSPASVQPPTPEVATGEPADEPQLPGALSPGMDEIVKLAQAHVDQNVILSFINSSKQDYSPTADEILYLSHLGLSQDVVAALFNPKPPAPAENEAVASLSTVPTVPFVPAAPLPATPTASTEPLFVAASAPSATWMDAPDAVLAWQLAMGSAGDSSPSAVQTPWVYVIPAPPVRYHGFGFKSQTAFGTISRPVPKHHHPSAGFSPGFSGQPSFHREFSSPATELARVTESFAPAALKAGR